jgi:hypothetical protein
MLAEIVRHDPGREVVMHRVLDLDEDCFARDHTIGGRYISKVDPEHHGLPIMPMTFILEMMAEAASVLSPGKFLTAVHNVQLFRWLEYDEKEPRSVEVVVRATTAKGTTRLHAEVRDLGTAARPRTAPLTTARAILVLDAAYPVAPVTAPFAVTGEHHPTVSLEQMYLNLFHGPLLQGVNSIERVGSAEIESRVEVLPREKLFGSVARPDMMLDPVLMDVVTHPLAAWHLEQPDQSGRILLPVGAHSLEFFGPPPACGTSLVSRGRVSETTVRSFVHEIEVVDGGGRVWARVRKLKYWRFYVPFGRVNFHGPKDIYFLSRRWTEMEAPAHAANGQRRAFAIMRLEPPADLQHVALHRVTAQVALTPAEKEAFRRLPPRDAETAGWLFDRIAAKDAVRAVWSELHQERLFPADIELVAGPAGLFRAQRRGAPAQSLPLAAVIRTGAITVAVSAGDAFALGIAVSIAGQEEHNEAPFDFEEDRLLAMWGKDPVDAAAFFRCAKRAVAGALKSTSHEGREVRVRGINAAAGLVRITVLPHAGNGAAECPEQWLTHVARDGDAILAWTAVKNRCHDAT